MKVVTYTVIFPFRFHNISCFVNWFNLNHFFLRSFPYLQMSSSQLKALLLLLLHADLKIVHFCFLISTILFSIVSCIISFLLYPNSVKKKMMMMTKTTVSFHTKPISRVILRLGLAVITQIVMVG